MAVAGTSAGAILVRTEAAPAAGFARTNVERNAKATVKTLIERRIIVTLVGKTYELNNRHGRSLELWLL